MLKDKEMVKLIFGLKIKDLRQRRGYSYHQLSELTGLSLSYLSDIEKGKKYPKTEKILALAKGLEVDYDELVSIHNNKRLAPVIDFLDSPEFKSFPLDIFGISLTKLFEVLAHTPSKINAFLNTILTISRNYQMEKDDFFQVALRSYQDLHNNYFDDLELAVANFIIEQKLDFSFPVSTRELESVLARTYHIKVDRTFLPTIPSLSGLRSYFQPDKRILYLNKGLSSSKENFLLGRELGFQYLNLTFRPYETRILRGDSFEKLLNNFKASYFSAALLMQKPFIVEDIQKFAANTSWAEKEFLTLLKKYDVSPEMLLQRLTNILPGIFKIDHLFFLRVTSEQNLQRFEMTKELHLSQLHNPYANEINEHYCRRWVAVNILKRFRTVESTKRNVPFLADIQISHFWQTDNSYLALAVANKGWEIPNIRSSVTLGLLINEPLKKLFKFLDDPKIKHRTVHTTCERCGISDCEQRMASPSVMEKELRISEIEEALRQF